MRLTPGVDKFLSEVAPDWRERLITENNKMPEINHADSCIMGEIHGWDNDYALPWTESYCKTCADIGDDMMETFLMHWSYFDGSTPFGEAEMRHHLTRAATHVRRKHQNLIEMHHETDPRHR